MCMLLLLPIPYIFHIPCRHIWPSPHSFTWRLAFLLWEMCSALPCRTVPSRRALVDTLLSTPTWRGSAPSLPLMNFWKDWRTWWVLLYSRPCQLTRGCWLIVNSACIVFPLREDSFFPKLTLGKTVDHQLSTWPAALSKQANQFT